MSRMRVLDIAKELSIETKVAIAKLQELGVQVKNHFNAISDTDAARLRTLFRGGKAVEKDSAAKPASKLIIRRKAEIAPEVAHVSIAQTDAASIDTPTISDDTSNAVLQEQLKVESETAKVYQEASSVEVESPKTHFIEAQPAEKTQVDLPVSMPQVAEIASAPSLIETPPSDVKAKTEIGKAEPVEMTVKAPQPAAIPHKPTTTSAVIVRKAEPTTATMHKGPSSFINNTQKSFVPNRQGQQHGYRPGGANPNQDKAPYVRTNIGATDRYNADRKPYVMSDTAATTATTAKDSTSRFKEKDREKRKVDEPEHQKVWDSKAKHKGTRRHSGPTEEIDDYLDFSGEGEGDEHATVRTMIPNRKKGSAHHLKKKEHKKIEPVNPTKASKKIVRVDEFITVNDLAGELSQKATAVIKVLMKLGMMATINQQLDFDTAALVAQEFGFEAQNTTVSIGDILAKKVTSSTTQQELFSRPPIVTIMGHVDHGKTSLLDAIRSANVAAKEAGGITQHIGAYQIERNGRKLTFLDTPGHEAFTAMRARGAQVTDIVILVVAADDGVMPQTIEAINHAKAANVPIIVAINKIDKHGVNFDRILRELAEHQVMSEEWGGESLFVKVSAKTGVGLDTLVDSILLQADVLELKAPKNSLAEGIVIEARLDKARGPLATVIVTKGTLKQQDFIVVGRSMGKVRAMHNDLGTKIISAEPATPVEIIGLNEVPAPGDQFNCVVNEAIAKEAVAYRTEKQRQKELVLHRSASMEAMLAMLGAAEEKVKELTVIIKADTHGSVEAIRVSLEKLNTAKVKNKIIHAAVGGITETDVMLAKASNAIILGFNVRPDRVAAQIAEQAGIKVLYFTIIYELINAVQAAMVGSLAPVKLDKVIGHAEVRNIFSVPKIGSIAGSFVTDGKVTRNSQVRIVRDGVVVYTGKVGSLKRFKDDAKEVAQSFECGINVENYNDIKIGDVLEAFVVEEVAATLN